ncbi:deaminase [Streptomyces sp. SID12488]|uniref:deaminase n=1 Tax=Streptomyces sp. SID12488 TaxID=2706040 RepID=UPI0013D95C54|nr:deaminase [Streptomyces sp. SID12488]NEA65368.1 CMP deaminase [Streptomyces sp. SID12488]
MTTPEGVEPAPNRETTDQGLDRPTLPQSSRPLEQAEIASSPELVFALVCTLGADYRVLQHHLESELAACGHALQPVRISDELGGQQEFQHMAERYEALMDAGDRYRNTIRIPGPLAISAIERISNLRRKGVKTAFFLDKLVRPDEVEVLRATYGSRLFLIACDAPRSMRLKEMQAKFMESSLNADEAMQAAVHAINRDAGEAQSKDAQCSKIDKRYRVAVGETLELADVFVRGDAPEKTREIITRLVQCIFSHPFHAPTLDELGMALAYQTALTSAALSRRVGAAIMIGQQIVAVGSNEVPRAGGGTYHEESWKSGLDARDFQLGRDPSDHIKIDILTDLLELLKEANWEAPEDKKTLAPRKLAVAMANQLRGCKLLDVIEYTRTTHAEMVAITAAARRGIAVEGATLFTTTLPCHECTRNIIATGIGRVVYLEPYPKSKGADLQSDSIYLEAYGTESRQDKIAFEPFSGFVYWRFAELFSSEHRKIDDTRKRKNQPLKYDGEAVTWKAHDSRIRSSIFPSKYGDAETYKQRFIEEWLRGELRKKKKTVESVNGGNNES